MADVTDRDRERAAVALNYGPGETVSPMDQEYVDQIAAALAEERAPFLALADEYDANINWREWGVGNRIRHAAEETE